MNNRQKGLITMIIDKINDHGYMMGAHRNSNWCTNICYDNSTLERHQGTLDRISGIEYFQSFHTKDTESFCGRVISKDLYNHSIRVNWKELFGPGNDEWFYDNGKSMSRDHNFQKQDKKGKWHSPCDEGIWISLWHPSQQETQERVSGYWNTQVLGISEHGFKILKKTPHWRPVYNYTYKEVILALKILCREFGWTFENKSIPFEKHIEMEKRWATDQF